MSMEVKMNHAEQEEIIRKYINAYNKFDIDSMLALLHSDIIFKNLSGGEMTAQTSGKTELEILARGSAEFFKSRSQSIRSLKILDNKAVAEIDFEAVLARDLPNGLKAGQILSLRGKSEIIFKDGLIISITDES
jgi:hypothetical protein